MKRNIALAIGVADAKPLNFLSGAINGARAFHDWASNFGYDSRLLIDDEREVTIPRLRSELEKLLRDGCDPIHRVILYFAGHGLIREAEEGLWLLSDWFKEKRAVGVEPLRRLLCMSYNIEQISIFSDCCRSLPDSMDTATLEVNHVLGSGPGGSQTGTAVDKFVATQDGSPTVMVPGLSPDKDRCVFSGLLIEGLWGVHPAAFSKVQTDTITSRSLGSFLELEVPPLAERYGWKLHPDAIPTFPELDDVYVNRSFLGGLKPPTFPEWPSSEQMLKTMGTRTDLRKSTEFMLTPKGSSLEPSDNIGENLVKQIRSQSRPDRFITGEVAGLAVEGGSVRSVWTQVNVIAESNRTGNWWRIRHRVDSHLNSHLNNPAPVLIEFDDGMFAATTALPNFIATVLPARRGISALIYRPLYSPANTAAVTEAALGSMENGNIRVNALDDLAVGLRQEKHYDPVLGVISAYLYDSIADIESIRRMAFYYVDYGQPIPYDIALLAQLPGEWRDGHLWAQVPAVPCRKPRSEAEKPYKWTYSETKDSQGIVGGLWPWLRQGWSFLNDSVDDGKSTLIDPGLLTLTRYLRSGRFTTLNSEGGHRIAELFNLCSQNTR